MRSFEDISYGWMSSYVASDIKRARRNKKRRRRLALRTAAVSDPQPSADRVRFTHTVKMYFRLAVTGFYGLF
jgi:hypothetical protein